MLDIDTRRRIDTARDILVGKVPDPKSQVEQITIALIYKFMDDMDAESEEMGGNRKFFAGEFSRYGWAKLMRSGLGGHETLNLYGEAIARIPENPGIPPLFRDIFKNAYLRYRDPETLRMFLKIIDEFQYDHSERLGDAFEYLLSVLGSQGDAGQFRTPRHIIDFIVDVVDPKKTESILDPACGTAGFLISSYKHILRANTDPDGTSTLTPEEKGRIAQNLKGYDISPDMVRLSLVNMYLHGFAAPHIYEYDTLTSEDRWNEHADVILANPPFMSPKGGIQPHNRFSVQSKRSEVLFVDYIAEHLTPTGRAGVIVPEGIIFQSQNAYKKLRQMLVEDYLVAVVSLPAGVFNPYSGVKTSVLFLDRTLAKRCDSIAFYKVENDGFDLGAQRRPIDRNDLPAAAAFLKNWLASATLEGPAPSGPDAPTSSLLEGPAPSGPDASKRVPPGALIVPKAKIAANGDYNLSGERYRENGASNDPFPLVSLGDTSLFRVESGGTPKSNVGEYWNGGIPWATLVDLPATDFISQITVTKRTISEQGLRESCAKMVPANSVVVSTRATIGRIAINRVPIATNQGFKNVVINDPERVVPEFVALALTKLVPTMKAWATGGTFAEISKSKFCKLQIPLPPLSVQKEIVAEIEGYQKVIDGARAVVENYRPHIPVDPAWPVVPLGEVARPKNGFAFKSEEYVAAGLRVMRIKNVQRGEVVDDDPKFIAAHRAAEFLAFKLVAGDILMSLTGNVGRVGRLRPEHEPAVLNQRVAHIEVKDTNRLSSDFLFALLNSPDFEDKAIEASKGVAQPNLSTKWIAEYPIPLPPLDVQHRIVAEIEAEQALVNANKELIERMAKKIHAVIARVWGETP
ncbi:MAG TPA: N-6 DNA methylase [Candidatus Latescibacteria bacterium]|nr:N-6 DNA methylase [Candidatus Latescibacterota bacterium]HPK74621.1 N-6 DNA methylase [Candidatus Latescibacterota bacterium]